MKKADINRLEKVVRRYEEIEKLLDDAYESIYKGPEEYVNCCQVNMKTTSLVKDMWIEARAQHQWIQNRIKELKELLK